MMFAKMFAKKRRATGAGLPVVALLLLALILTACGAADTATPVPTATATPPPTATAVPPTTVPTTIAATAAGSSGTPALGGTSSLPAISGVTEITIDPSIIQTVLKQFPGLNNPAVKFYVSDDAASKVSDTTDAALTGAGYAFSIPGSTKPAQQNGAYAGLYTKASAPDVVMVAADIPSDPTQLAQQLNLPGITPDIVQKLATQVKGKKSILFIVAAPGLVQALFNSLGGGSGTSTTPGAGTTDTTSGTPGATPTA